MSQPLEPEWVFPPEQFTGDLVIDEQRIPICLTASAGPSGSLELDLQPISISDPRSAALTLKRSLGQPGNVIDEFALECESSDGKRLTSDDAYLTGYNYNSEGLHIQLRTSKASLTMNTCETHHRPSLCFSLLAFSCYPPVYVETPIGIVVVRGATRSTPTDNITGLIAVEAPEGSEAPNWRKSAEHLLERLRSVLAFARGAPLSVPVTQFYEGDRVEVTLNETDRAYASQMPPLPPLNLAPIVSTAVANIDIVEEYRDTFELAIGWLLIPTTHDEMRFLSGMTALECVASKSLTDSDKNILDDSVFKEFPDYARI